ncbi:uncharacterized protein MYCGRDRAFT_94383 [Zymoseptoria tritici IPO323]|uniref:Uncharacterized protein n=1 Tax=Zymoseptoria tritici (strain CBS 115943 / IPO323) TaxID=336722 RepID=F9XFD0_ZYMTI|nr:uncharacterized protein MYCGRDRAFT_94383 [Zymoseptoria tritici IPO323]EGP86184.1 hypothetical protein MYCGRDRAFT_94383 [Zymoseptoria tritici IPO323]
MHVKPSVVLALLSTLPAPIHADSHNKCAAFVRGDSDDHITQHACIRARNWWAATHKLGCEDCLYYDEWCQSGGFGLDGDTWNWYARDVCYRSYPGDPGDKCGKHLEARCINY